jgi:flagellar hook-associated protein 3 FlgL
MTQISTASAYAGVLNNLLAAETQQTNIGAQISSEQVATNLQGYSSKAESLTALQSVLAQVTGYLNNSQNTQAQLSTQDTALTQIGSAATDAAQAVRTALAAGNGDTLVQSLQSAFQNAVQGLNATFNGNFVFGGGNANTPPVSVSSLSALGAAPSVASVFTNGQFITNTQITSTTNIQTGFVASQLGTPLFTVLQSIQTFDQGPNGPFADPLTPAQQTFLQGQITALNTASTSLNDSTSQNGQAQAQLTNAQTDLTNQQTSLNGLIGDITNVNLAQASSQLSQAQTAVQASARVFEALQTSSLLSILTASGAPA